jgi:hypothetical protein
VGANCCCWARCWLCVSCCCCGGGGGGWCAFPLICHCISLETQIVGTALANLRGDAVPCAWRRPRTSPPPFWVGYMAAIAPVCCAPRGPGAYAMICVRVRASLSGHRGGIILRARDREDTHLHRHAKKSFRTSSGYDDILLPTSIWTDSRTRDCALALTALTDPPARLLPASFQHHQHQHHQRARVHTRPQLPGERLHRSPPPSCPRSTA